MAGLDRVLDPQTKDYVLGANGAWQTTRTAATAIYHAVKGNFGQWPGDPDAGSRFFELARAKSIAAKSAIVLADISRGALKPLVDEGRITEPQIVAEREIDRVAQSVVVYDRQTGEQLSLTRLLSFNV